MLDKNTKYICYVFSEYKGFVARIGGVARTGLILYDPTKIGPFI